MHRINWLSHSLDNFSGYGRMGDRLAKALARTGIDYVPVPPKILGLWDAVHIRRLGIDFSRLTVSLMPGDKFPSIPGRQWAFSMTESDTLPATWGKTINETASRCLVPSEWLIPVFRKGGVDGRIPIDVVPAGVDPFEFPYMERPSAADRPYTFLAFGDRGGRKGDDVAHRAFFKAFDPDETGRPNADVRLVIKARPDISGFTRDYPNLSKNPRWYSIWLGDVPHTADIFAVADCLLFPTRGEGYGLPPREAAATGLPVIATRWAGTAVDLDQWGIPLETFTLEPTWRPKDLPGKWAEPSVDELAEKMRWCYEHQAEAREIGKRASDWVHANLTWDHSARALKALLEAWA